MANEYVTLADLKVYLGGVTDSARNDILNDAIAAASKRVETFTGRRFYLDAGATARTYDPRSRLYLQDLLLIDDAGVAPTLVEVGSSVDGFTAVTDYELGPENALVRGVPIQSVTFLAGLVVSSNRTRVRVTARWGFPAIPPEVEQATMILAARLFKRKDSPEGVLGSSEWGTVRITRQDSDVADLLSPFVVMDAV